MPSSRSSCCWCFMFFMAIPFLLGILLTINTILVILRPWSRGWSPAIVKTPILTPIGADKCYRLLEEALEIKYLHNLNLVVHRNGEATPCGFTPQDKTLQAILKETIAQGECPENWYEKYEIEAFLTRYVHNVVASPACSSTEQDHVTVSDGLIGYCDWGQDRTPILKDQNSLIAVLFYSEQGQEYRTTRPCHFHLRSGERITSMTKLSKFANQATARLNDDAICTNDKTCLASNDTRRVLEIFAVPAGRHFQFAPSHVGERIDLPHIQGINLDEPVYMHVLSVKPRVFELFNFFSAIEGEIILKQMLQDQRPQHQLTPRISRVAAYETGYNTDSKRAFAMKQRSLKALGFDQYQESHCDGLQIAHYPNKTNAYMPHMDYIEGTAMQEHDYESYYKGGNRFATLIFYISNATGGATVFTESEATKDGQEARALLQQSEEANLYEEGSWRHQLALTCRSRLTVEPRAGRAILFYSQLPNGDIDRSAQNAECPLLDGPKYTANLWVWNTPRQGYEGSPKNSLFTERQTADEGTIEGEEDEETDGASKKKSKLKTSVFFENTGESGHDEIELYYRKMYWGVLRVGDAPMGVNSKEGHVWHAVVNGEKIKTWTIGPDLEYSFTL